MTAGGETKTWHAKMARRWLALLAGVFWLSCVSSAFAIEVVSPESDYLDTARLTVNVGAEDATGTVVVSVDGVAIDTRPVAPGESFSLSGIDVGNGIHQATAVIRTRDGVTASPAASFTVWSKPIAPVLVTPSSYSSRVTNTAVRVGDSTNMLYMYVNGELVNSRAVVPFTLAGMGEIELRKGENRITLVARNPVSRTDASFVVTRMDYPWPTCIIIDKSDYRLYWVRDGRLVETYPIAIGKPNTPTPSATWRIDAKYHTDPAGVYGPRKMRLFRQTSSGFAYTAYGIHGTNQEWVIGTMASHGCIRMYNRDVLELFPQVPLGTMVQTRQ